MSSSESGPPRVARLTPRGRGAVATLRLCGSAASLDAGDPPLFRAANGQPVARQRVGRIAFGHFGVESPEEIVLCRLDESSLELHCHGGDAAVERILGDLEQRGVIVETWQEQCVRHSGRLATECVSAVAGAATPRTASLAHTQASGVLREAIDRARSALPDLDQARELLLDIWRWRDVGRHLTEPWRVAVAGRPNVGKSSLINALLGYDRSIVFDAPGTTRDLVTGETAFAGWPVQLADTAGLREATGPIEAEGIRRARHFAATADLVLIVLDRSLPPSREDLALVAEFPMAILVANKCDLPDVWGTALPATSLPVSATTRQGLDRLTADIVRRLVPEVPGATQAIPVSTRQIACLEHAFAALDSGDASACHRVIGELLGEA